jgi:hypothetical protein
VTAPAHFFAAPDFLELLQFWDGRRKGRQMPDWSDDLSILPANLLPNMTISDRRAEPTYLYVGSTVVQRWGSDPTGKKIHTEALSGAHSAYIKSLAEDCMARRAPIFSAAVYQRDVENLVMTGRLFAPFTWQGSERPQFMATLQLFQGSERALREIGIARMIHETRRDLIAMVPEVCAKLEEAQRYYRLSQHTHQRGLARNIERIAQELAGSALVPLPIHAPDT